MTETNIEKHDFFGRALDQIDDGDECQEHRKIECIKRPTAYGNKIRCSKYKQQRRKEQTHNYTQSPLLS